MLSLNEVNRLSVQGTKEGIRPGALRSHHHHNLFRYRSESHSSLNPPQHKIKQFKPFPGLKKHGGREMPFRLQFPDSNRQRCFSKSSMSKDTPKAIAIIVAALLLLVVLLSVANHFRPHP